MPAYNEETFVKEVIEDIPEFVDRIYFVDDRSQDRTVQRVLETAAQWTADDRGTPSADGTREEGAVTVGKVEQDAADVAVAEDRYQKGPLADRVASVTQVDPLVLLEHDENRGAGGAIKTGYLASLVDRVDIVATIDADGQMDPTLLDEFLDPIIQGEADYTKGNRLSERRTRQEMPRFRLFGNVILTLLTRVVSGYWDVTDPQNGYTAIRRQTLECIDVEGLFEYYGYTNDILVRLNAVDATVTDVPLRAVYNEEKSHIQLRSYVWRVWLMLVRNLWWRLSTTYLQDGSDG